MYSFVSLWLSSGVFHSVIPAKALYAYLFSAVHVLCPVRLIFFDLVTRIIFGVGNKPQLCVTSDFRREVCENCVLIMQRVVVILYRRIGSVFVDGTDRLSRNVDKELLLLAA